MHVFDGRKLIGLVVVSAFAALLVVMVSACGDQADVPEPVADHTVVSATAAAQPTPTVAVVELVEATPTPYSQSMPSPVVVTATPEPKETAVPRLNATATAVADQPEVVAAKDIDCGDFGDWIEAQEVFLRNGGLDDDPYLMDTDMDGIACNAETDRGYDVRVFASADIPGPTPAVVVAATPTAAVATPGAGPSPTQASAVNAGDWPTPEEIGAVKWGKFIDRGYFTKGVPNGSPINVYEGPMITREVTCGPEIGTAFDSSNPTWSDSSHLVFVWSVVEGWGSGNCRGVSKYEDWVNKPLPAPPLESSELEELFVKWGEPLKFAVDDTVRDFSLPDWLEVHYVVHSRIVWDDGWESKCDEATLPWSAWDRKRGFYTISIEDEEAMKRREWKDEQAAMKEEGRARGLYYILDGGFLFSKYPGGYCWHVPNHDEIPPHRPCLECQWRGP